MKKILLSIATLLTATAFGQTGYFQEPLTGTANPGGLNTDLEDLFATNLAPGWTSVIGSANTGTWSAEQTIPFSFKFNDVAETKYKVHGNGVVTFTTASAGAIASTGTALPDASIPDKSITLWGLRPSGPNDNILKKTFGTAPNRQHWIMFNSCTEANISNGFTYMSIVLEETTNKIYIVDQRTSTPNVTKIVAGIQVDGSTAYKVNNANTYASNAPNTQVHSDNKYFTFAPGSPIAKNARLVSFNSSGSRNISDAPFDIEYTVGNNGSEAITDLKVSYKANSGAVTTDNLTGLSIASGASVNLKNTTKWTPISKGNFVVEVTIDEVNGAADQDLSDNKKSGKIRIIKETVKRIVLHEQFTSSTCGPCTPGNANVNNVLKGQSDYTIIKYQMNYPQPGDPYYNAENTTRHNYYGVLGIPNMVIDGFNWQGNSNSYSSALLTAAKAEKAIMTLSGSAKNEWKGQITCDVSITPNMDFDAGLKFFAVVVEKSTFANVGNNGEKEFDHVVKKIMTGVDGKDLPALTDATATAASASFTFKGFYYIPANAQSPVNLNTANTIENFDDLMVVAWVQDAETKEVFQSVAFDVASTSTEDISTKMNVYPNPATNQVLVNVEALSTANSTVHLVNVMGQVVANGNTNNGQFTFDVSSLSNGIYTVKMIADSKQAIKKIVVKH